MRISTVCFPIRGKRIILAPTKRGFGAGKLNGYGGKWDPEDATVEDAAVREVLEEGGVTVPKENLEKVAVINFFRGDEYIFECHIYFCREWEGEFVETEEMGPPEEFEMFKLPFDRMFDADGLWLSLVCAGQKIKGECHYNQEMKVARFEYDSMA